MSYDNILKTISGQNQSQSSIYEGSDKMPRQLSALELSQNYATFSDLQKQGVYLPDLVAKVKEVDELKRRLDEVEKSRPALDTAIFSTMEAAVADNPAVEAAKRRMDDARETVLRELCMKDPRFTEAYESYKTVVNREYVQAKEGTRPETPTKETRATKDVVE